MKKTILLVSALAGVTSQALASTPTVTLGGKIDTYVGWRNQKSAFEFADPTVTNKGKVHDYALVNDTRITVSVENQNKHGVKYGAFIKLNADVTANSDEDGSTGTDKVVAYVESPKLGRLEAGSFNSASDQMKESAATIARATGGIDGESTNWMNKNTIDGRSGGVFIKVPNLPVNCDCISDASKVTYFTPVFYGFQGGLSYAPDVEGFGTIAKFNSVNRGSGKWFEKVWDGGIKFDGKVKNVGIKATLMGEIGDAKNSGTNDRKGLRAWKVGGNATYKNVTVGGSYGDWVSSGRPIMKQAGAKYGAHYWTAGAAATHGKLAGSVTYVNSQRANLYSDIADIPAGPTHDKGYNKFENLSFGIDYQCAPGLLPFVEVSVFKAKQAGQTSHNSGTIVLAGSKLSF